MIEEQLLEYINSGQCYALVGSGPSCEMGYPTWKDLATLSVQGVAERLGQERTDGYEKLIRQERFPDLFERVRKDIGEAALLEIIRTSLRPVAGRRGDIYSFLAKWPFAGYLTTNFDDELNNHLRAEGVFCRKILNSPADFSSITATSRDFVAKIHGEIGSDRIVLWSSKYAELRSHDLGAYFRQKVEAIFSMFRVCIVGYGLRDPDIEFILEKAKQYSTPENPLFMMATDVNHRDVEELFDKYNIRVIPYENADGTHRQLRRMLNAYDVHIIPRSSVSSTLRDDRHESELASSLFLFTQMQLAGKNTSFLEDAARTSLLSALRDIPEGLARKSGAIADAVPIAESFWRGLEISKFDNILDSLQSQGTVKIEGENVVLTEKGLAIVDENRRQRELLIEQFEGQARLDFQREFIDASSSEGDLFSKALSQSLVHAFRKRGLEIANFIVHQDQVRVSDATDLFRAFKNASAVLHSQEARYFFIRYASNILLRPNVLQKQYLWHLSQGYFAYHALGLDPSCKIFRKPILDGSVWILDSSVIIPLLAKGCLNHRYTVDLFTRLSVLEVPAITLTGILEEVADHATWARDFVRSHGEESPQFLKVALAKEGSRPNLFIDGYIQSHIDGACLSFAQYMTGIFGDGNWELSITRKLGEFGIRVLRLSEWPGFTDADYGDTEEYIRQITLLRREGGTYRSENQCRVEAEVCLALLNESARKYHFRKDNADGDAYFVSESGFMNALARRSGNDKKFVWKPEAFYRFLLCFPVVTPSEDYLQQCMLGEILTSGMEVIDAKKYQEFFRPLIRQARMTFSEVVQNYHEAVRARFPVSVEDAFDRTPDLEKPFFPLHMAEKAARSAARQMQEVKNQLKLTEKERQELAMLRKKFAKKAAKGKKGTKGRHGRK